MSSHRKLTDHELEQLSAYLDHMLEDGERSALESRLATEPDLQSELESLRQLKTYIRALPTLKAPRNFTLTREMIAPQPRVINFPTTQIFSLLSAVASIALIITGVILFNQDTTRKIDAPTLGQIAAVATQMPTPKITNTFVLPEVGTGGAANDAAASMDDDSNMRFFAAPPSDMAPLEDEGLIDLLQESAQDAPASILQDTEMPPLGAFADEERESAPETAQGEADISVARQVQPSPQATELQVEESAPVSSIAPETQTEAPTPTQQIAPSTTGVILIVLGAILLVFTLVLLMRSKRT